VGKPPFAGCGSVHGTAVFTGGPAPAKGGCGRLAAGGGGSAPRSL